MKRQRLYHAVCQKFNHHFLIEAEQNGDSGKIEIINFQDLMDDQLESIRTPALEKDLSTAGIIRPCAWCGTRIASSCTCCIDHGMCPSQKSKYCYQCLFCKHLVSATSNATIKSISELRISVSSPGYDNIEEILTSMNLNTKPFMETGYECDVLFLNCGSKDPVNATQLRDFVRKGGCVYMSDFAEEHLNAAFPGKAVISRVGQVGTLHARVLDQELRDIIGPYISVEFDLGSWAVISKHPGEALIETAQAIGSQTLMFTFTEGKGQVFYTSFHNYVQADEKEKTVLKVMLARQIGAVTHQSTETVFTMLGMNITALKETMDQ